MSTQGLPQGVDIHSYAGQMVQNPAKYIKQPYPNIIEKKSINYNIKHIIFPKNGGK